MGIRLGIIGTGRIAKRFVQDSYRVKDADIVSVYNPHIDSSKQFSVLMNIGNFTDDWEMFLGMVDAVYIASPHNTHYTYSKRLLIAGKHVLCEKPMAFQEIQASELFDIADRRDCVLMEAIKTSYCPGFCAMMEMAKSGVIGSICDVEACFTKLTQNTLRELTDVQYGGSLTELGSYVLLPIIRLLGCNYQQVNFLSVFEENGLDIYTRLTIEYEHAIAAGKVGLGVKSEGQLIISGTKGYILAEAPWWLTKKFEVRYEDTEKRDIYTYGYEGDGLWYELQAFIDAVKRDYSIQNLQTGIRPDESVAIASVMETFLNKRRIKKSAGD